MPPALEFTIAPAVMATPGLTSSVAPMAPNAIQDAHFVIGDNVSVGLHITNHLTLPLHLILTDPYYQNRLQLLKDGQPVAYKDGIPERLRSVDKTGYDGSAITADVQPKATATLGKIDLNDWYDPLQPGQYQLTILHRFFGPPWIRSNTIKFDVNEQLITTTGLPGLPKRPNIPRPSVPVGPTVSPSPAPTLPPHVN